MIIVDSQIQQVINSKRELFRVKIRKENNEKQFSNMRQQRMNQNNKMASNYLQEMILIIRDSDERISKQQFEKMIIEINHAISQQDPFILLDAIDAAVWMLKGVSDLDFEEAMLENENLEQLVQKIINYSQGYNLNQEPSNQLIIIYASKFLKHFLNFEVNLDYLINLIGETIYFLLTKQEINFIKCGLNILRNVVNLYNQQLLDTLYSLQVGPNKIINQIGQLLFSNSVNANSAFRKNIWRIIAKSIITAPDSLQQFMNLSFTNSQQEITFYQILIDECVANESENVTLINQLQILLIIIESNEELRNANVSQLKVTKFPEILLNKWLFGDSGKISTLAHEIQTYLEA